MSDNSFDGPAYIALIDDLKAACRNAAEAGVSSEAIALAMCGALCGLAMAGGQDRSWARQALADYIKFAEGVDQTPN